MAMVLRRSATLGLMVVLVVVMAVMHASASDEEQPCGARALFPCLVSARGPYPPAPDAKCCSAVKEADPSCLCKYFDTTKLSQTFVNNVLAMPKACGRNQLSGTHCGNYVFE